MEKILEKSGKSQGILSVRKSGNPGNVNDALEWSYFRMIRGHFCSHHMPIMLLFFPLQ